MSWESVIKHAFKVLGRKRHFKNALISTLSIVIYLGFYVKKC